MHFCWQRMSYEVSIIKCFPEVAEVLVAAQIYQLLGDFLCLKFAVVEKLFVNSEN